MGSSTATHTWPQWRTIPVVTVSSAFYFDYGRGKGIDVTPFFRCGRSAYPAAGRPRTGCAAGRSVLADLLHDMFLGRGLPLPHWSRAQPPPTPPPPGVTRPSSRVRSQHLEPRCGVAQIGRSIRPPPDRLTHPLNADPGCTSAGWPGYIAARQHRKCRRPGITRAPWNARGRSGSRTPE